MRRLPCICVALGLVAGCGDSNEPTGGGGTAGAAGGGGAGGTAGTPSDSGTPRDGRGPMPPAAQGSVSLHLTNLPVGAPRCSPGLQWVNAPSTPTAVQMQRTSGVEIGDRAVDGVAGSHVACTVQKSGDQFSFAADITTPRTDGVQVLHPTVLHFEVGAIGPNGPGTLGTVTVMNDTTGANFIDEGCSFSVTAGPSAPALAIDQGKIWALVGCGQLTNPSSPDETCVIDSGYLVFENCVQ